MASSPSAASTCSTCGSMSTASAEAQPLHRESQMHPPAGQQAGREHSGGGALEHGDTANKNGAAITYTLTGDFARAALVSGAQGVVLHSPDGGPDVLVALSVVPTAEPRTLCVCVDASEHSEVAWKYACANFVRRTDRVLFLTVVLADSAAWDLCGAAEKDAKAKGQILLDGVTCAARTLYPRQVDTDSVRTEVLCVEKHSAIGEAIVTFLDLPTTPNDPFFPVNTCVLGSRGMGAVNRKLSALMGLGSVSDYVLHNTKTCASVFIVNATIISTAAKQQTRPSSSAATPADDRCATGPPPC